MEKKELGEVVIIINNRRGFVRPSETFLTAHINGLPNTVPLIGIPGRRFLAQEGRKSIPSRALVPLGIRWLLRKLGVSTIAEQDRRVLARFLKRRNIAVVLAEYGPTAVSVMDACRDASVPLVAHFHGFDAYRHDIITAYKGRYLKLFSQAAAVIAVSNDMRRQLLALGANEERTYLNSCGADIPEGLNAQPGSSDVRFLMVGRLVDKKAPLLSIEAFARVIGRLPESRLDIIGDGPLLDACKSAVVKLGLSDNVVLHGTQLHSDVLNIMKQARCFIQHSVCTPNGDREGTPVAVLEAMGVGLPVIATRHGGIRDVIEDGITGKLVEELDVDAMANAMLTYAEDADLAQSVGEKARAVIQENWTSDKSTSRLWEIISDAMRK